MHMPHSLLHNAICSSWLVDSIPICETVENCMVCLGLLNKFGSFFSLYKCGVFVGVNILEQTLSL